MKYAYGHEQLMKATITLRTGPGSEKQRLSRATEYNLSHITPDVDLPEEIRADFQKLISRLMSGAWGDTSKTGSIIRTVQTMDDKEVESTIKKVFEFHDVVRSAVAGRLKWL